jgi:hypothetical protein
LQIAADKHLAQPSWTLEATVALIHIQEQGTIFDSVRAILSYLDTAQPAFDPFVRLQEQR